MPTMRRTPLLFFLCRQSPDPLPREQPTMSSLALESPMSTADPLPAQDRALVLVVDDSPIDRRIACTLLEKNPGIQTTAASDGRDALESMKQQVPAAVLTDLQMPEMDGLQLV